MSSKQALRIAQFVYLKPDQLQAYKDCHAEVWPEVLEQIKDSNIEDYSIFITMIPRPMLFASFKYVGSDWAADMERMTANPRVREWWKMTDGMQESPIKGSEGSTDAKGWWSQMEEVFRLEDQVQ